MTHEAAHASQFMLDEAGFAALIAVLRDEGYTAIGPRVRDGAIIYEPVESPADLPVGIADEQEGGHYRLKPGAPGAYFDYNVGPTSWKRYLFPPKEKLWSATKGANGFELEDDGPEAPAYAFIGVRSCELAAIRIQDRVFGQENAEDPRYNARRRKAFLVAVNCTRAGKTCFCASMGTGPKAGEGFDLSLTELRAEDFHLFVVEAGTPRGVDILSKLPRKPALAAAVEAAEAAIGHARGQMGRAMEPDAATILKRNPEHPRWDEVATRCLGCANCTMVCPTCFCHTVEDTTDLSGDRAERWRLWDSCFNIDFSYIHGGSIRREGRARYRQWITHKLAYWHDQFNSSGCVGCGRCITWCPVGIDITEEVRAIRQSEQRHNGHAAGGAS